MNINLSSLEIWDELEVKLLQLAKDTVSIDLLLSERITSLVNHFNGSMGIDNQYICIDMIDTIISNLQKKDYFTDRKYTTKEEQEVRLVIEDLILISKVLKYEYKVKLQTPKKEEEKIDRLPNIKNEKAMDMFKPPII